MTYEEQLQYDRLSFEDQLEYDHLKAKHPNWSHNQILMKLSIDPTIGKMIEEGRDVNPEDPRILKEILEGAKSFLIGVGIFIESIFEFIDDALCALGELIYDGISYVGDKLEDFWNWLTD